MEVALSAIVCLHARGGMKEGHGFKYVQSMADWAKIRNKHIEVGGCYLLSL